MGGFEFGFQLIGRVEVVFDGAFAAIAREIKEETNLDVLSLDLVGVADFQRMNQVIITYHAVAEGEISLSPELVEYKLLDLQDVKCWPAGTGLALAQWLRSRGIEPQFIEFPKREE